MKKLSELNNDTMLTVQHRHNGDFSVMSKEDFLDSSYFLDYPVEPFPVVTVAETTVPRVDLESFIEYIGEDETYEGWAEDVCQSILSDPITQDFLTKLNHIISLHPVYWEGEPVEVDIFPNDSIVMKYEKVYLCPNDQGGEEFDEWDFVPHCNCCDMKLDGLLKPNYCSNCGVKLYWHEVVKQDV